jgi:L-2-hydroxycarboxylate dehydrogenase (NAD+)
VKSGGGLLPLGSDREHGSHKGYGLGAIVDIFSGVLSGANFGPWVPPFATAGFMGSAAGCRAWVPAIFWVQCALTVSGLPMNLRQIWINGSAHFAVQGCGWAKSAHSRRSRARNGSRTRREWNFFTARTGSFVNLDELAKRFGIPFEINL